MNKILSALLVMFTFPAWATTEIKCTFTEPFFDLNIDLQTKKVTEVTPDWDNMDGDGPIKYITKTIAENASLQTDFSDVLFPKYQVLTKEGQLIAALEMNMRGSDGMSNVVFPLEVKYGQYYGGCSTDLINAINPHE